MLAKVPGGAVLGIEGYPVFVEVDVCAGLPAFEVVGLPDAAIREARERVRAALRNSGYEFPLRRITVNLAPAMIRKEGACFDLPIAIGILAATGELDPASIGEYVFAGELSLDGQVRRTPGILSITLAVKAAGFRKMMVAKENEGEAALVDGLDVYGVSTLSEAIGHLSGVTRITKATKAAMELAAMPAACDLDFQDVSGQDHARRALEVAAAGGHNILMVGPPGAGKTMLARRVPAILPPLSWDEALEVTRIYSAAGLLPAGASIITARPFRSPHHTISAAGLIGGGRMPKPGEISLAHRGVLFLDEIPEFGSHALEALRQPLEDGFVTVARSGGVATFPARFMLLAAANLCPCGKRGDGGDGCKCTPTLIQKYLARLSGPLLDRIDLHIEVGRVEAADLEKGTGRETSYVIRERVVRAREVQRARFRELPVHTNAEMGPREIRSFCELSRDARTLLYTASSRLSLSARAHARVLKVARTIADLEESTGISASHVAEAVGYRALTHRE